jgi:hypothetical protein
MSQRRLTIHPDQHTQEHIMKAAIIIFSDPKHGGEEALGRLFNGLAAAYDFKQHGTEVAIYFQGTGTRWAVADTVAGVSCGCADVFGAREDAEKNGFDLVTDNSVPGTSGLPSIAQLVADGYAIYSF